MTRKTNHRTALASGLVLTASLSLAACGSGASGGDQATGSAPRPSTAEG